MKKILLADDHPMTLNGIKNFVQTLGYEVVGTYTNGIAALNNTFVLEPDFCILDISMPGVSGLDVLKAIRNKSKTQKVILYTMYHEQALFEKAKTLGVNGYVLKDFALEELKVCLNQLQYKKQWFTPRLDDTLIADGPKEKHVIMQLLSPAERKIVELIAKRLSSKKIAEQLFISEKTVENHRSSIIKKLDLPNGKNNLLLWAIDYGS